MRAGRCARCGGACIRRATRASRAAGCAGSGPSTTSASAFAAPSTAAVRGRRRRRCASSGARSISRRSSCWSRFCGTAPATRGCERLTQVVAVDRRTVARWRRWWRDTFTSTPFWRMARAGLHAAGRRDQLPASLLDRFGGDARIGWSRCCASSALSPEAPHARLLTGAADPQSMLVAGVRDMAVYARRSLTEERRHGRGDARAAGSRAVGALALLRHRTAVGRAARQGRAEGRDRRAGRGHLAASDHGRARALRLLDHRALVLPCLARARRSGGRASPQAARRCRSAACASARRFGAPSLRSTPPTRAGASSSTTTTSSLWPRRSPSSSPCRPIATLRRFMRANGLDKRRRLTSRRTRRGRARRGAHRRARGPPLRGRVRQRPVALGLPPRLAQGAHRSAASG